MQKLSTILLVFFLMLLPINIYGITELDDEKSILITRSEIMKDVVFDGKWTSYLEWKNTSWNPIKSDDSIVYHLRSAHQEDFIYLFVDVIADKKPDFNGDKAMICIDSENNKSEFLDDDDYCFIVKLQELNFFETLLNQQNSVILQAKSSSTSLEDLEKITSREFIGIGTVSDKEDRYSTIPHASYEFKIPIELIGRSDNYGFFVNVFDSEEEMNYSWPESIYLEKWEIPSPSLWGNLISPDKSLPEFELPMLVIFSAVTLIIIITSRSSKININYK
jgi:hypothetical protein